MKLVRIGCALALLALVISARTGLSAQIPERFTNLTVLPKDIARPALVTMMRNLTMGLGVRCEHCHVGEGNDLSKFDFAADTKPAKNIARKMLQMTTVINQQVAGIGEPSAAPKVTCFTCHRGALKPLTERPAAGGD
jgi:hypothetical protein